MNPQYARRLILGAIGAAIAVTLTACGETDSNEPAEPAPAVTITTTTAVPTSVPTPTVVVSSLPAGAVEDRFLDALKAIDPGLAAKPDEALDRGRTVCQAVDANPTDQDGLIETVEKAFADADNPAGITNDKALRILEAVRTHLCAG